MFKNNPLFFINFLFLFNIQFLLLKKLCFAENTIKIVFSGKHSFSKTQLVKPTFSTMSKNTFFKENVSCFWFWAISAETPIFIVFPGLHCFGPKKKIWAQTDSCNENARFFSLPDTNSVRQCFAKNLFFWFFTFLDDHLKKTYFYRDFLYFPFFVFFFFLFLFSNIKKKQKMQFSFRKPLFW